MKTPGLPFTGIDDPYEEPLNPEVIVSTDRETVEESAVKVILKLEELGESIPFLVEIRSRLLGDAYAA